MSRTAFALREEFVGTVEVELADGTKEDRPRFGGGVLALGESSFDVADLLADGDGLIVVEDSQQTLVALLSEYPALKEIGVPVGAKSVNLYSTWSRVALLDEARRRGLVNPTKLNNANLSRALQRQDELASDPATAREADGAVPEDLAPGTDAIELAQAAADADKEAAKAEKTDKTKGASA